MISSPMVRMGDREMVPRFLEHWLHQFQFDGQIFHFSDFDLSPALIFERWDLGDFMYLIVAAQWVGWRLRAGWRCRRFLSAEHGSDPKPLRKSSMLTDEEKWRFDLQGYLVLRNVLPPGDLVTMIARCDEWHALPDKDLPPPLRSYQDPGTRPTSPRGILDVEYADPVFDRLILNPAIMRVVLALTHERPQHLLSSLTVNTWQTDDIHLHGGTEGSWHNPANDYQASDGRIFATFLNAAVSLVDVPPGCGFVCIPGSHKSHFHRPDHVDIHTGPPLVVNVPINAGDAVIFTETLCHGALPWTPRNQPRRTVFSRYSTSYASWSPGAGPKEEFREQISTGVYELKQQAGFQRPKKVVEELLRQLRGESA